MANAASLSLGRKKEEDDGILVIERGEMAKGLQQLQGQNLPPDVAHVVDQLERHCLAPDGSLGSKSAYYDLQLVLSLSLSL